MAVPDDNSKQLFDHLLVDIADYVYHYEVRSAKAIQIARLALLDALGCTIETVSYGACSSIIGPTVKGTIVPNGFCLPGTAHQLDPVKGAFDLAVLIRYLDHSDGFTGAEWGHPSDNIGAILATADWLDRNPLERSASTPFLTLHTILIATIKAYEIQGCLQLLNAFNAVGLDHVILVKVASTAVVSWLLGLTESQALHAISQAWMDGHPLRVYRHAPNAGPRKGWAGGDACMRAVHLALLTRAGQPGAPTVLSVKRWGFNDSLFRGNQVVLARTLGSWVMENIFFKIVPAEGHALSAIEAMLILRSQLIEERRSLEEDILKIKVRTHAGACLIINKSGELHNAADRDHCIQYMLAVVLLKGELLEYADYEDDCQWATDPRIKALRAKIELTEDPQFTTDYHDPEKRSMSSGLTLELIDGTQLGETIVEYPLGNLKTKGTIEGLRAKLYRNLDLVFERSLSERIETAVQCEDDMPVKDFMDLLWKGSIL